MHTPPQIGGICIFYHHIIFMKLHKYGILPVWVQQR